MGRKRKYQTNAERQREYRRRRALKRNDINTQYVTKKNHVYCMDSLDFLRGIPSETVDIVITSPPYNLRNSTGGFFRAKGPDTAGRWRNAALRNGYADHDDNMPRRDYIEWQTANLREMYRIIKPTGAIFYNHKPRPQNGLMETPDDIVRNFPVRQIIIWDRGQGFNFNDTYFVPTYEFIYMIPKPEFKLLRGKCGLKDVWRIRPDKGTIHPAPFPLALPDRILDAVQADLVIDPFAGSGTVAMAAKMHGIDYMVNDVSKVYVEMAEQNIARTVSSRQMMLI